MQIQITKTQHETPTTHTFVLEKPAGFTFAPGQFILVTLEIENPDKRGNRRPFSITSAPDDNFLMFTTKHGDSRFKEELLKKKSGDTLNILGPMGQFVLADETAPIILLAGGIGITPFHSMIKNVVGNRTAQKITLLYSVKNPDEFAFKEDFDQLAKGHDNFSVVYTVTDNSAENWSGNVGRIDTNFIKNHVENSKNAQYYICGPTPMVNSLTTAVKDLGIPKNRITSEQFSGY